MIFCKLKIGTKAERRAFMDNLHPGQGFEIIKNLTSEYAYKATGISRNIRAQFVFNEVWSRLTDDDAKVKVANKGKGVFQDYKELGFDGTVNGDPEGVYDFIFGTLGTSFENDGILQQTFSSIEGFSNNTDFANFLKDIIIDGKFLDLKLAKLMKLV